MVQDFNSAHMRSTALRLESEDEFRAIPEVISDSHLLWHI